MGAWNSGKMIFDSGCRRSSGFPIWHHTIRNVLTTLDELVQAYRIQMGADSGAYIQSVVATSEE